MYKRSTRPFQKGDNYEKANKHLRNEKKNLQNHSANINQTLNKTSLGEGDAVCSNERPRPFPREYYYNEIRKIHWRNFKSSCQEPLFQVKSNLAHSILGWWARTHLFKWRARLFPTGDYNEIGKIHCQHF